MLLRFFVINCQCEAVNLSDSFVVGFVIVLDMDFEYVFRRNWMQENSWTTSL